MISTHEDITQHAELAARLEAQNLLLKQHQSDLAAQNVKFDAALKNMSQGLAMFDAEQCVVIANERYAKLYGLNLADVKPGTKAGTGLPAAGFLLRRNRPNRPLQ